MAVGDSHVFPGFLAPVLTQLFFPKPPTTFLTCFCRVERRKYARKKSRLNRGSNSRPTGHESDTLTTELPGRCLSFSRQHLIRCHIVAKAQFFLAFFDNTSNFRVGLCSAQGHSNVILCAAVNPLLHKTAFWRTTDI